MSREEIEQDGQHGIPGNHEGRFGDKWDAEIHIPSVVWIAVGIAVVTAFYFVWSWLLYGGIEEEVKQAVGPQPVVAREVPPSPPPGPLLQAKPEEELEEMRRELGERLGGYGWVDESAQTIHIPIDEAIVLVLEHGLEAGSDAPEAAPEEATEDATAGEAPSSEEASRS